MTFESFWDLTKSPTSLVRVNPIKKTSANQEYADERRSHDSSHVEPDPSVIDVEFEDLRSFPVKYTLSVYNDRGEVVTHECAPSFLNLKA